MGTHQQAKSVYGDVCPCHQEGCPWLCQRWSCPSGPIPPYTCRAKSYSYHSKHGEEDSEVVSLLVSGEDC